MLKIECLNCCKPLEIPEWVNTDNYDGEIVCKKCCARLAIKFKGSEKPAKYKLVEKPPKESIQITHVETIKDYPDRPPTKIE